MTRALILTLAALLAAPALADEPAPKAPPAPATAGGAAPRAASGERPRPDARRATDLRPRPRTEEPAKRDGAAPARSQTASKPPPCVEVKPCSID
ncbi:MULTISPECIES: hypothetical protein [Anaeromyxobacter]|uniref:hypothetical protein n=1 Tax=Anaeromyxobacter TaxID=161492 RepID=UPI001F5952BC|nr:MULTISPECIES: hypothetical protein [unclassified Anaeromyxobacter]